MTTRTGYPTQAFALRAVAVSTAVALYLKFLLPATAGLFYELYHLLSIDALYSVYIGFKVSAVYFAQWSGQNLALAVLWILVSLLVYWKNHRRSRLSSQLERKS